MNSIHTIKRRALVLTVPLLLLSAAPTHAEEKIIRLVVGFPAGGSMDTIARLLSEKLREPLGQQVIVDNRPGAQARIAAQVVKSAHADGTTLMVAPGALMYLFPHAFKQLGYEPFTDYTPVSQLASWDLMLAVAADSPIKTFAQFITWAQANPKLSFYGSSGAGSLQHFMGVALSRQARIPFEHVSFKGGQEAVTAMMGGHVPAIIMDSGELLPLARAGKVRILANFGSQRDTRLPEVPTIRELGYGALEASGWAALYAPASTPAETIARLNAAVVKALAAPEVREKLLQRGMEARSSTPKQIDELGRKELSTWRDVVKASGFTAD